MYESARYVKVETKGDVEVYEKQQVMGTFYRGVPKIGRNEKCPCGSGRKFKKCCGR